MGGEHLELHCDPATDRSFEQILWDKYLFLMTAGGVWPFMHTRAWRVFTVLNYIFMYTTVISTMAILAYTCYLTKDYMSLFSQTCHIFIVGAVVVGASCTLSMNRARIAKLRDFFDNPYGMAPYAQNEFFRKQVKKTENKKIRLIVIFMILYGSCGTIGWFQPFINSAFGGSAGVPRVEEVWTNIPFALWVPYYNLEEDNKAWLAVFMLESLYLAYAAVVVIASVVSCFDTLELVLDQLKLNIHGVENLEQRAEEMFKRKYPGCDRRVMENEFNECFYVWFEHSMDLASIPIAIPFFGGALLLGMALITLTSTDDPRVGPKVFAAILAVSEGVNMYLLCRAGQDFEDLSLELFESLFFAPWYHRSIKCTKAIITMRHGCTQPLKMTAARLLELNMQLFADLVNSAYSIFNLKAASSD